MPYLTWFTSWNFSVAKVTKSSGRSFPAIVSGWYFLESSLYFFLIVFWQSSSVEIASPTKKVEGAGKPVKTSDTKFLGRD